MKYFEEAPKVESEDYTAKEWIDVRRLWMTNKNYAILLIGNYPDIVKKVEGDEGNLINVSGKVIQSELN